MAYSREKLIELIERDLGLRYKTDFMYCREGVQSVLDALKEQPKTGKITLPDVPTSEMLRAVFHDGAENIRLFDINGKYHSLTMRRYNQLKAILERPTTKTVTLYVLSWARKDNSYDSVSYKEAAGARSGEKRLKELGYDFVTVTEIQQTVYDTTN